MSGATPQDEALQALLAAGQLEQAARRCLEIDEPLQASALFEEACLFGAASHAAERGGDLRSAVRLAAIARDDGLVVRALDRLVDVAQDDARKEAAALLSRGAHRYAAWAFDRLGDAERAAEAYKKAELPLASAHAHARAGQVALAARTLETAIREAQGAEIEAYRVALGELYGRHGKHEAAATHLQAVPKDAPQRGQALEILIPTLEALGLHDGAAALEVERETLSRLTPDVIGVVPLGEAGQSEGGGAQAGAAPVMVTLFGRYRVLREVAVSPHARLLHAVDELTGEEVAVKWLAATGSSRGRDALSHFVREARALSDLRHPAIVSLRDYVERGPAMVLEWMSGGALDALLAREVF